MTGAGIGAAIAFLAAVIGILVVKRTLNAYAATHIEALVDEYMVLYRRRVEQEILTMTVAMRAFGVALDHAITSVTVTANAFAKAGFQFAKDPCACSACEGMRGGVMGKLPQREREH